MGTHELNLLGPLEVRLDGEVLDLGGPKQRGVLALLLLQPGVPVSLDRMIEELWGDAAPGRATASLQAYVSHLRRLLEPDRPPRTPATLLVSRPPGYALDSDPGSIDAVRFERLADQAADALAADDPAAALAHADAGLALWRGEVLADLPYDEFVQATRHRLDGRRLALAETRIEALLDLGQTARALADVEALVAQHPLREHLTELRMLALYRLGRQGDALRAYQEVREQLGEELGLDPGPALRALEQRVLEQDPDLDGPAHRPAGAPTPSAALEAAAAAPAAAPTTAPPAGPTVVGRDAEQDQLRQAFERAAAGTATFALVTGEAGIGKSTLLDALAVHAAAQGALVAWGRSQEQAGEAGLWPWSQAVRSLLGPDPVAAAHALLGPWAPGLERLAAPDATAGPRPGAGDDGDPDRLRLFDAVRRLLTTLATEQPVVVLVEDLHWADLDSLRLLEFLGTELHGAPVLVVTTVRDEDALLRPEVGTATAALARRPELVRIAVRGLPDHEVGTFAAHVAGLELDDPTVRALAERTSGNPFYLTELVRLLTSERRLEGGAAASDGEVPASVRDVVRRRLDRLPDDSRSVLQVAALLGREITLDLLAQACGLEPDTVFDALEPPLLTGLLVEGADDAHLRFSHALVAETLADDLPPVRRRRLHARIGGAIEAVHGGRLDPQLSRLAHHFGEAASIGHAAKASSYAAAAAEQAEQRGAVIEAARLWQQARRASELDPSADPHRRLELQVRMAEAEVRSYDLVRGRASVIVGLREAIALGDRAAMAAAATALLAHGSTWQWSDMRTVHADVLEALEDAEAALGEADSAELALVRAVQATAIIPGDPARGEAMSADALAMARRVGGDDLLATGLVARLTSLGAALREPDYPAAARELEEVGRRLGSIRLETVALVAQREAHFVRGEVAEADAAHARASKLLEQLPHATLRAQAACHPVRRATIDARWADAEAAIEKVLDLKRVSSLWGGEAARLVNLVDLYREQGRLPELAWVVPELDNGRMDAVGLQAELLLQGGDPEGARAAIEAAGGLRPPRRDWWWMVEVVTAVEVAVGLDDRERAAELYADLLPLTGQLMACASTTTAGPVDLALGRLARTLGRDADAGPHLRDALAVADRIGSPVYTAQAMAHLARLLEDDPAQAKDPDEAATLRSAATTLADQHGLHGVRRTLDA